MMSVIMETVGLIKEFPQADGILRVLKGIDLKVIEGEFMAIMGPSGSGKSTLLNMLGALDKPSAGKVFIQGTDLSTFNDNELADLRNKEIGFVFQFFNLIQRLNALSNVELPMAIAGLPYKERRDKARNLLTLVGLGERMDHKPSELSGGEQQRVAIARALVNDPSVLLCDEVTGNLDSKTGFEVMELLLSFNKEQGKTFILITHDPNVAKMAQRLVQIQDGEIIGEKQLW
ncbi:MAG: ABC transporter ATP-binding protein [Candidatus Bathyarchaeota archaeon]|jgi:putative ABC transport system ATP-binding protein|nr:ABC transporter ATP-binding protein [Candidatus Bathyarchaeota archaeon]MDP7207132.1 ABC transporter ATP-binding protein [Candidatus Bathyarchaeota archaeon]MDP7443218.1 ABC transporter ATP-binding protein [Candidatus Bathyarchaeota archaeon]|tara:strand:+ start:7922 stop:8614 length:693 start_codon:yes stop_codon:yes gene_type:complete